MSKNNKYEDLESRKQQAIESYFKGTYHPDIKLFKSSIAREFFRKLFKEKTPIEKRKVEREKFINTLESYILEHNYMNQYNKRNVTLDDIKKERFYIEGNVNDK